MSQQKSKSMVGMIREKTFQIYAIFSLLIAPLLIVEARCMIIWGETPVPDSLKKYL
ncbi:MAG: hypothetical protein MJB12_18230 [Firmicutes bacterium]|nr:hypothetical protein [Bacillota bacterium]